jgi:aliphatic nitrilase
MHKKLIGYGGGFAQIFGPDGRALADRLPGDEEGILYAEINLAEIAMAKQAADPVGHYSRRDVFTVTFNDQPLDPIKRDKDNKGASFLGRALPQTTVVAPSLPIKASDLEIPKLPSEHEDIENEVQN